MRDANLLLVLECIKVLQNASSKYNIYSCQGYIWLSAPGGNVLVERLLMRPYRRTELPSPLLFLQ